jgi:hypothetical protein
MGGMTLGKSAEQMMQERDAINAARRAKKMRSIRDVDTVTKTDTPEEEFAPNYRTPIGYKDLQEYKSGGKTKGYAKGGSVRGGGCESRGKTKGRFV